MTIIRAVRQRTREDQLVKAGQLALQAVERHHSTTWRSSSSRKKSEQRLKASLDAWNRVVESPATPSDPANRLRQIVAIILAVENRCMAVDGPVTPTTKEMTEEELRRIYQLANGE